MKSSMAVLRIQIQKTRDISSTRTRTLKELKSTKIIRKFFFYVYCITWSTLQGIQITKKITLLSGVEGRGIASFLLTAVLDRQALNKKDPEWLEVLPLGRHSQLFIYFNVLID